MRKLTLLNSTQGQTCESFSPLIRGYPEQKKGQTMSLPFFETDWGQTRACPLLRLLLSYKLRIGFHATLCEVHTFGLFFLGYPDAHDGFYCKPYDQAGDKYPYEDC